MVAPAAIPRAEIDAAQADLFQIYPSPETILASEPDTPFSGAFGGLVEFPFAGDRLQRLIVHPLLLDLAETVLRTPDIRIYQVALWAKYAGAADYEQDLHADYLNHTVLVPSDAAGFRQLITWILLSDVAENQGATRLVSRRDVGGLPPGSYSRSTHPHLYHREVAATGPAGTVFAYGPDVLHRGAAFSAPSGGRFTLTVSFRSAAAEWGGNASWPGRGAAPEMSRFLSRCSVRERQLFGVPAPGHAYWTPETLAGVAARYPEMDISPYELAATGRGAPVTQPPLP